MDFNALLRMPASRSIRLLSCGMRIVGDPGRRIIFGSTIVPRSSGISPCRSRGTSTC